MKKNYLLKQNFAFCIALLFLNTYVHAQTNTFPSTGSAGIGTITPNASSILEMVSTSKGMLVPRMTKNNRDAIATPATGLLIYQTTNTPGFYYYNGSAWTAVTPKAKGWSLTGNAATDPAVNFIGTTDYQPLTFKVNNQKAGYIGTSLTTNTGFGYQTLNTNTTGVSNTANGFQSLNTNTSGSYNTGNGVQALYANNTGHDNTATGFWSLVTNTTGYYNTATGGYSLYTNSDGIGNTANGISALRFNTHGSDNTAAGANTLFYNTTGYGNVAIGSNALFNNTIGNHLVAIGDSALYNQSVDPSANYGNVAVGFKALYSNSNGFLNTATGITALYANETGHDNTGSGYGALFYNNGNGNTGFGATALANNISGNNNTAVGYGADFSSDWSNSSAFGYSSYITASNQVRIGDASVLSIGGYRGWTNLSDGRVKKNIKENVPGLAFINLLKPITYNLDLDEADKIVQRPVIKDKNGKPIQLSQEAITARKAQQMVVCTGFIAQDVEATAKKIGYDFDGVDAAKNNTDLYGLRYAEFVVPLVKAVQELSKINDDKDAKINELETRLVRLEAMLNVQQSTTTNNKQQTINISSASLEQNIPNPFNQSTSIHYNLPSKFNSAQIVITDYSGKTLKQINISTAGKGILNMNAGDLSSGTYNYSLIVDGKLIDTKKMVLTK